MGVRMTINSYAVVAISKAGVERVLNRFPADEQDAAIRFALGVDMKSYEDVEVRPSRERPPRPAVEFCPPFKIDHRHTLTLLLDAEGKCAAQFLGPQPVRQRMAKAAAEALS